MINQKWDYAAMENYAKQLDNLRDASNTNKTNMDRAFEVLISGVQAEVGRAFTAAYADHVPSIILFAQILDSTSQLLRNNANVMQSADMEIASQIRQMFAN
jgi:uncharacterized protein YukE